MVHSLHNRQLIAARFMSLGRTYLTGLKPTVTQKNHDSCVDLIWLYTKTSSLVITSSHTSQVTNQHRSPQKHNTNIRNRKTFVWLCRVLWNWIIHHHYHHKHGKQRFEVRGFTKRIHQTRSSLSQTPYIRRQRRLDRPHLLLQRHRWNHRCRSSIPLSNPSSSSIGNLSHSGWSIYYLSIRVLLCFFSHSILTQNCYMLNYA